MEQMFIEEILGKSILWLIIIVTPLIMMLENRAIKSGQGELLVGFVVISAFSLSFIAIGIGGVIIAHIGLLLLQKDITFGVMYFAVAAMILYVVYFFFMAFILPAYAGLRLEKKEVERV